MTGDNASAWTPERIRCLREARGLTQEDFAHQVGVRVTTINRWENGHARPTLLGRRRLEEIAADQATT